MKKLLLLIAFCTTVSFSQFQYDVIDPSQDSVWNRYMMTAPYTFGNVTWIYNDPNTSARTVTGALHAEQFEATVNSSGTTETTLGTYTLLEQKQAKIKVSILGVKIQGSGSGAVYDLVGLFYRLTAGSAVQVGTTAKVDSIESDNNYTANFDVSGNDVRIRVTGLTGGSTYWKAFIRVEEVTDGTVE